MPGSRASRSSRPLTTDSPALRIGDLRRARALVPGEMTRGEIRFQAPTGALMLMVEYLADMRKSEAARIELRHRTPGEAPASPYEIDLGLARCCCTGGRWAFRCPVRRTFSGVLYNPIGTDRFLSSRAHGMRTPSDSYASHHRPLHRFQRAQARLEAALPKPYPGGRGADKLVARLDEGDSLVTWKIDRLGRTLSGLVLLVDELRAKGVRLVILTLGLDTATPAGRMILGVMASLAEFERAQLIERTNAGIAAAKRRGVHTGRPHPLTAHQRTEAARMASEGKSCGDIAAHFNVSRMCAWRAIQEKKIITPSTRDNPSRHSASVT
jgi:hypothetical protein